MHIKFISHLEYIRACKCTHLYGKHQVQFHTHTHTQTHENINTNRNTIPISLLNQLKIHIFNIYRP